MTPYQQLLINCGVINIDTSGWIYNGNLLSTKDNWPTSLDFVRAVYVCIDKICALWCSMHSARPLCTTLWYPACYLGSDESF